MAQLANYPEESYSWPRIGGKVVMDIKQAVRIAKDHISELFGPVASLRLEEVSLEHE